MTVEIIDAPRTGIRTLKHYNVFDPINHNGRAI